MESPAQAVLDTLHSHVATFEEGTPVDQVSSLAPALMALVLAPLAAAAEPPIRTS